MTAPIMFPYSRLQSVGTQKNSISLFLIVSLNYFPSTIRQNTKKVRKNLLVKMGAMALSACKYCGCVLFSETR